MKVVKVDQTLCIGCGTCCAIADAIFFLSPDDGLSKVKLPGGELKTPDDEDLAQEAVDSCPAGAISISEK